MSKLNAASSYFAELGRIPMISRERELALATQLRQHGDRAAADRLVTAHLRLVVKLAREYCRPGTELLEAERGGSAAIDSLGYSDESPEDKLARAERAAHLGGRVRAFASRLGERDRKLFEKRWQGDTQSTLAEIGTQLRVSRERVRQLEKRILGQLRRDLRGLAA